MSQPAENKEPTIDAVPSHAKPWPIRITFIPEPTRPGEQFSVGKPWAGVPTLNRLKKLLKTAKRGYGFRCCEIYTADPEFASAPVIVPPKEKRRRRQVNAA